MSEVTRLLADVSAGRAGAADELYAVLYRELRGLAARLLKGERADHTLQTTALVNEAYLRLVDQRKVRWENRAHFFALASRMMRRILVDYARKRRFAKRGGGARKISLEDVMIISKEKAKDVVALDEALTRLAVVDPRKTHVVELRFFAGLTIEEIAEVLKVSPVTVRRDWSSAKAWLYRAIPQTGDSNGE